MSLRIITTRQVIALYDSQVAGGTLRNHGRLDLAVAAPFHAFLGLEPYPTVDAKAGKLLDGIQRAQAYSDGNKRLAWVATLTFLNLNGWDIIDVKAEDVDDFVRSLASASNPEREAAAWLRERMRPVAR